MVAAEAAVDRRAVGGGNIAILRVQHGKVAVPRRYRAVLVSVGHVEQSRPRRHGDVGTVASRADWGGVGIAIHNGDAPPGDDLRHARAYRDCAAPFVGVAAADAGGLPAAPGVDASAVDGYVAAAAFIAAADARPAKAEGAAPAAFGRDRAALDDDAAAGDLPAAADAGRAKGIALRDERAGAADDERAAFGDVDAGVVVVEANHPVLALKHDRGVAEAGDARPHAVRVVHAVDGRVAERHRRARGDAHLAVDAERAGYNRAVGGDRMDRGKRGKVAVPGRRDHAGRADCHVGQLRGNGHRAARGVGPRADSGRAFAAVGDDRASVDVDGAAVHARTAADARAAPVAAGRQRAGAADVKPTARRHVDSGIVRVESPDGVRAFKDQRGVALAGEARPRAACAVHAVDDRVGERHRRAVGDGHLVRAAERAVDRRAVRNRRVEVRHTRQVHVLGCTLRIPPIDIDPTTFLVAVPSDTEDVPLAVLSLECNTARPAQVDVVVFGYLRKPVLRTIGTFVNAHECINVPADVRAAVIAIKPRPLGVERRDAIIVLRRSPEPPGGIDGCRFKLRRNVACPRCVHAYRIVIQIIINRPQIIHRYEIPA